MRPHLRSDETIKPGGMRFMLPFDRIEPFMAALQMARTIEAIRELVDIEVRALGFDLFAYVQLRPAKGGQERIYFGTYPTDWAKHYAQHDLRLHDPVWGQALATVQPFLWQDVQARDADPLADRIIYGPSADAGLRAGAGVPLHGPMGAVATLQIAKDCNVDAFQALFKVQRPLLQLVAFNTHAAVMALLPIASPIVTAELSPRQRDVLLWMIRGKTNWEIGELLSISEDTVRQHMIRICRALGASNRAQAAVLAVTRGLIVP